MKIFGITLICVLIMASCKKDLPLYTMPLPDCANITDLNTSDQIFYQNLDNTTTVFGSFNPNNSDQILYYHGNTEANNGSVNVFDLNTQSTACIYQGNVWERPYWSAKNWIVFGYAQQIFKIKSDGDSLTQLTFQNENYSPIWSYDGSEIIYRQYVSHQTYSIIRLRDDGYKLDSIPNSYLDEGVCNGNNQIVYLPEHTSKQIAILDLDLFGVSNSYTMFEDAYLNIHDVKWIPNTDDVVWSTLSGIFRTNLTTLSTTKIKEGCDFNHYLNLDVSSDGLKILTSVFTYTLLEPNLIGVDSEIRIMNIDGTNETEIIIE